jgi:hypothetical protein
MRRRRRQASGREIVELCAQGLRSDGPQPCRDAVTALVAHGSDGELLDGIIDVIVLSIAVQGELGPQAVEAHLTEFSRLRENVAPASDHFDRLLDTFSESLARGKDTPEYLKALEAFYEQRGLGMANGIVWGAMLPGAALARGRWQIPSDLGL